MHSLEVFDVKRCDNPECLWSEYKLMVDKSEVGDDGFQRVILISSMACQCTDNVLDKISEIHEFAGTGADVELGCLMDCD